MSRRERFRTGRRLAYGAACLATLVAAGWGGQQVWWAETSPPTPPVLVPSVTASQPSPSAVTSPSAGLDRSAPVEISIDSINVHAALDEVGLAADGTLDEQPLSRSQ